MTVKPYAMQCLISGPSPSEGVKLLRLPVEDVVTHHELVLLDSRLSQSSSTKCQILIGIVEGDGSFLLDLQDSRQISLISKTFGPRVISIFAL